MTAWSARVEAVLRRPPLLVALVALVVVAPIVAFGELSAEQARQLLREQEVASARTTALAAAAAIRAHVSAIRDDLLVVAQQAGVQAAVASGHEARIRDALTPFRSAVGLSGRGPVAEVMVTDRTGLVLDAQRLGRDLSGVDPFPRIRSSATSGLLLRADDVLIGGTVLVPFGHPTSAPISGDVGAGRAVNDPSGPRWILPVPPERGILMGIRLTYAIDPFVGALLVRLRPEQLGVSLGPQRGDANDVYLVDAAGLLLAHAAAPNAPVLDVATDLAPRPAVSRVGADASTPSAATLGDKVVASAPVGFGGWRVVLEQRAGVREAAIEGDLAAQRLTRIALGIALLIGAVVLARTASASLRRRDELGVALEQQTATADVLKTISQSVFDLERVLRTMIDSAGHLSDADVGWINRVEGRKGFSSYGRTEDLREAVERAADDIASSPTRGERLGRAAVRSPHWEDSPMGRAMTERRTLHFPDIVADPRASQTTGVAMRLGTRSVLAVPLLREGTPIGTIIVARLTPRPFSPREIALVETFADQAVIAIENVRLFNEIEDKSHQLEEASRNKSEFLANMSHELRTPLNAIIGFNDVVRQGIVGEVNEKQSEYLGDVRTSAQHLLSLINEILDLSKVEAGRMELEAETFSLGDVIGSSVAIIRERATSHAITVQASVPDDIGAIDADQRKVKQILFNLLSNAVKFTPDGGRIEVRVARSDGEIVVSVRDTGVGIAAADRDRLFEEFRQVRGTGRAHEGTGLGLALSRKFVELHGGRMWVESEVGSGSTFTFTLPVTERTPILQT